MRKPFNGSFPITQHFNDECCRASYAKFNLKGHNGIDYGCPTGTQVIAPHRGIIREAAFDPLGYGWYIKIESEIEGSVLAHLKSYSVEVGQLVQEGQNIGISDNTGNSTGEHLHHGYYRIPRDRTNGFNGFIDQTPYLNEVTPPVIIDPEVITDQTVINLGAGLAPMEVQAIRSELIRIPIIQNDLNNCRTENEQLKTSALDLQIRLKTEEDRVVILLGQLAQSNPNTPPQPTPIPPVATDPVKPTLEQFLFQLWNSIFNKKT